MAVRAHMDQTKQRKLNFVSDEIHDKCSHDVHSDTVTQRTTFFSYNTMFI